MENPTHLAGRPDRDDAGAADTSPQLRVVETSAHVASTDSASEAADFSMRLLRPPLNYLRERHSQAVFREVLDECGLGEAELDRSDAWVSHERFERVLYAVRNRLGSDNEFHRACAYDIKRMYGPVLLVLRCMTVRSAYALMARTSHLTVKAGRFEVVNATRTSVRLRYTSSRPESRLMCLSRQAVQRLGPSLWLGMAPGVLQERKCIAHGDDACLYDIKWHEPLRLRSAIAGALLGAAAGLLVPTTVVPAAIAVTVMAAMGLLVGIALEQRRVLADFVRFSEQTNHEFERVAEAHAHAISEVLALHERERQWTTRVEALERTRQAEVDEIFEGVRKLAHDLNNPMTAIALLAGSLRNKALPPGEYVEIHRGIAEALGKLERLVNAIRDISLRSSLGHPDVVWSSPVAEIHVTELTERIRRQLKATTMSRDIRVSVFATREAPDEVYVVPLLLERVLDNLLTNASKYTERGSILVEVTGQPGWLVIKISDSGRGIATERLEQVFRGGEPDPAPVVGSSRGVGLSTVVRLLAQMGGRLEIMSVPRQGTTIWVYVPVRASLETSVPDREPASDVVARIVKIRPRSS